MSFWIFQDKPNRRIAVHRSECGTRNVQQGALSEGRSWHGPYPNYDEALGKAKRCLPVKALKSTAAFATPNTRPDKGTWSGADPRPATEKQRLVDGLPRLAHRAGGDERAFVDEQSRAQAHWPPSLGNSATPIPPQGS